MIYTVDEEVNEKYGPGIVGIFTATLGRYREFDQSKDSTVAPMGSLTRWAMGLNAASMYNNIIREMLNELPDIRWIWTQGDDHVWHPELLLNLLRRDVDIIVPLIFRKTYPFLHVIHVDEPPTEEKPNGYFAGAKPRMLDGKKGVLDISDYVVGNAGMLCKREVFEAMDDPWYEVGMTDPEYFGGDLWFAKKAKNAGFKLHIDLDNMMGHVFHMATWPRFGPDGVLGAEMRPAHDVFRKCIDYDDADRQRRLGNYGNQPHAKPDDEVA